MKVAFRFDFGKEYGFGHVIRCRSIINELLILIPDVEIVLCTNDSNEILKKIPHSLLILKTQELKEEQYLIKILEIQPDIVFIDKLYPYSAHYIKQLRERTSVIMIHNLCEGSEFCDFFILPTEHDREEVYDYYRRKIQNQFRYGGRWVVIGEHIKNIPADYFNKEETNNVKIAVTTGGTDPKGVLLKVLKAVKEHDYSDVDFDFLIGEGFLHREALKNISEGLGDNIVIKEYNVKSLLAAFVVVTTFGISTYELAYLKKPIISIGHAVKNAEGSKILSFKSIGIINLGLIDKLNDERIVSALDNIIYDKKKLKFLGEQNGKLVDGKGGERIANLILRSLQH